MDVGLGGDMSACAILITGASSGIGAACARRLAGPGVAIAVHARRNLEGARAVAAEVVARGGTATTVAGDLAEAGTAARLVEETVAAFGRLDVAIANAGFADRRGIDELQRADVEASLSAMPTAFWELAKAFRPHLVTAGPRGRLIGISSFVAHVHGGGLPRFPASAAAKAGLEAFARTFAAEIASCGATVNCVAPGFVEKDPSAHAAVPRARMAEIAALIPLRRYAKPEEIAAAVAFLCSEDAAYITGQTLHVNGGLDL